MTSGPEGPEVRRSLWHRFSVLVWSALHIRTIVRRVVAGIYAAEDARARIALIEKGLNDAAQLEDAARTTMEHVVKLEDAAQTTTENIIKLDDAVQTIKEHVIRLEDAATRVDLIQESADGARRRVAQVEGLIRALVIQQTEISTKVDDLLQQLDSLAEKTHRIDEQTSTLKGEVIFQQRQLTRARVPMIAETGSDPVAATVARRFDTLYAALAGAFRANRDDVKKRLRPYAERLVAAGTGHVNTPIVDIGCGGGEWLEVLQENGLRAYGIDVNAVLVERNVSLGLDAREAEFLPHLANLDGASRSAVTAFHIIDHLAFGSLVDLIDEAFRVLIPGGMLVLETNCPEATSADMAFDNDPTHRTLLKPDALKLVLEHRGFIGVDILPAYPATQERLQDSTTRTPPSDQISFSLRDYAVIARRP
jgi:SAM-dependent methyltransferase